MHPGHLGRRGLLTCLGGVLTGLSPVLHAQTLTPWKKLAAKPLSSIIETKRLLKKSNAHAVAERITEEANSFGHMLREPAAREAFTAFMEKRKPDFSRI